MTDANEEPKKVRIVVENYQDGNHQFPGLKSKYKELFNIPGGSHDEKVVVAEVEEQDFDEIKKVMSRVGVSVQNYDEMEDEKKSTISKIISKLFGGSDEDDADEGESEGKKEPEPSLKELQKTWHKLFRTLNAQQKRDFSNFDPKSASEEELKAQNAKALGIIQSGN